MPVDKLNLKETIQSYLKSQSKSKKFILIDQASDKIIANVIDNDEYISIQFEEESQRFERVAEKLVDFIENLQNSRILSNSNLNIFVDVR